MMKEVTYQELVDRLTKKIGEMAVDEVAAQIKMEKLYQEIDGLKQKITELEAREDPKE